MKKIEVRYTEPGGIIWKVLPDVSGDLLVIETRDGAVRKTMLSVLDLRKNKILYTIDKLPKPWWVSLKAVDEKTIVLQGYKESNSPEPGGIYLFDLTKGSLLWKDDNLIFHSYLSNESILVSSNENGEELMVDVLTGKTLTEASAVEHHQEQNDLLVFPLLYNEDNAHYKTITDFIEKDFTYKTFGPIEYLEYKGLVLISFYIQENNKKTNMFLVLDENGECVLEDRLIEGSSGIGMSAFFICKDKLIYIKNKTSIALAAL